MTPRPRPVSKLAALELATALVTLMVISRQLRSAGAPPLPARLWHATALNLTRLSQKTGEAADMAWDHYWRHVPPRC